MSSGFEVFSFTPCSRRLREVASDQLSFEGEDGCDKVLHNRLQKPGLNLPSSSVVLVFSMITFKFLGPRSANSPFKSIRSLPLTLLTGPRPSLLVVTPGLCQWFPRMQNADDCLVSVKFEGRRMLRLPGGKRRRGAGRTL